MKKIYLLLVLSTATISFSFGQKIVKKIKANVTVNAIESKMRFLASDELRGRDVGSPEIDIAAVYIAEQFRALGLQTAPSMDSYYQPVALKEGLVAKEGMFKSEEMVANGQNEIVFLEGKDGSYSSEVVFVNFGLEEDYKNLDVKGKIVVAITGNADSKSARDFFPLIDVKKQLAALKGALGLIELYKSKTAPWQFIANRLTRRRVSIDDGTPLEVQEMFYGWLPDANGTWENHLRSGIKNATVQLKGAGVKKVAAKNIIGWVEGKDPVKKNEFLVMTAHYDHVGVTNRGPGQDSIFNGARDNAIGVATLLETARLMAEVKPAYSVVFIALTAEEKGLLGSKWYAQNPVFPLEKTFFNFNTDGGGYNDTSIATVIGLNRTGVTDNLKKSGEPFGLKVTDDPSPEQGLFDRSDNVSFASKGIPALTFSCGFTGFDEEIMKFYHQPVDEVDGMDMEYLVNYARSFVYAAWLIANSKEKPFWSAGDKYEQTGKDLYNLN